MTSSTNTNYLERNSSLDSLLAALKVTAALIGILILCLLVALRLVPSGRLSTLLLLIASVGFMLVKNRGERDVLHPIRVFGALWCFCLSLASMRILPVISDWSFLMWSCVLTALASFIAGFWLAHRILRPRKGPPIEEVPKAFAEENAVEIHRTLMLAALCILVGTVVLTYEYHLIGGVPLLSDNPDEMRTRLFGWAGEFEAQFDKLYIKVLHPLVEFIKYGVLLTVIALCQKGPKSRRTVVLAIVLIAFGTLALGSQAGRTFFIGVTIPSVVILHYLRRHIQLRQLAVAAVVLFIFLGFFGLIRMNISNSGTVYQRARDASGFPEGAIWDGVAFGYMTLTISFETFNRLTEDLQPTKHPSEGYLFYAFHRLIPRANIEELANNLYSIDSITSTFLGEFYADYGYWGVLLGPLVLGVGYGWAFSRASGENPLYWVYVRALLIQNLIFFPYVNLFSHYLTWIFDLFFMYVLIRWARPKEEERARLAKGSSDLAGLPV